MIASRFWRKAALVAHVTASVGWIGAIAASLGLAIAALVSDDPHIVSSTYVALNVLGRYVLVPFALAALLGGVAQSLITKWGLFRHYWVIFKLGITIFAAAVLLLYLRTLEFMAGVAAGSAQARGVDALRTPSVVLHATAALLLLLVATVLAVYKPEGMTAYGRRKERMENPGRGPRAASSPGRDQ